MEEQELEVTPEAQEPTVTWAIEFKGNRYEESDLTGEHLMNLTITCGDEWRQMTPLNGPVSLMSFMVVFHTLKTGDDATKTWEELKAMSVDDILACLQVTELD